MILESRKTTWVLIVPICFLAFLMVLGLKNFFLRGNSGFAFEGKNINKNVSASSYTKIDQIQNFSRKGKMSILFGGDMMFDRHIRTVIGSKGFDYVLGDVKDVLHGVDFAVANLEGPITDSESKSVGSEFGSRENYIFTFPKGTAEDLFRNNISIVNIGNNHILNFGQDGLVQTRQALKEADVRYFGDPSDMGYGSYVKEYNGIRIGLVCYNQFSENGAELALIDVADLKDESDVIILYAHWGAEYQTHSNQNQRDLAHKFVDAGVDLVIGSHPHVVQEIEDYQGKKIYYSLGNFVFDQYFEDATKEGLLVEAVVRSDGGIETRGIEIRMDSSGKTSLK